MPKQNHEQVFLCLSEAEEHQETIKDWDGSLYEEYYPEGFKACMTQLEDGSFVSAWVSMWIRYYG